MIINIDKAIIERRFNPCPVCGGEIEERGGQCDFGRKIMVMALRCKKCVAEFKFDVFWKTDPYKEAIEAWNRLVKEDA